MVQQVAGLSVALLLLLLVRVTASRAAPHGLRHCQQQQQLVAGQYPCARPLLLLRPRPLLRWLLLRWPHGCWLRCCQVAFDLAVVAAAWPLVAPQAPHA
jgi:hypothetical protein